MLSMTNLPPLLPGTVCQTPESTFQLHRAKDWKQLSQPLSHLQMAGLLETPPAVGQTPVVAHCRVLPRAVQCHCQGFD